MSLKEAYTMAHTAQCRLQIAAGRPDRDLRFVVGHLMHYESLRLRIVEIEHDISKGARAKAVAFKGTGHINQSSGLARQPSTGQLGGRRSPPPAAANNADDEADLTDDDSFSGSDEDDDGEGAGLGLERFPSGTAQPPRPPPDLVPDLNDDEDEDEAEPISPEEPDQETLAAALQGEGNKDMATLYSRIRSCTCSPEHKSAPPIENFWALPAAQGQKEGVTRAVAQASG